MNRFALAFPRLVSMLVCSVVLNSVAARASDVCVDLMSESKVVAGVTTHRTWKLVPKSVDLNTFDSYAAVCRTLCDATLPRNYEVFVDQKAQTVSEIQLGIEGGLREALASQLAPARSYCFPSVPSMIQHRLTRYDSLDLQTYECFYGRSRSRTNTQFVEDFAPNGHGAAGPVLCVSGR